MVKIKYKGHRDPCRIRVLGVLFDRWAKNEVKELPGRLARKLIENNEFVLAKGEEIGKQEVIIEDEGFNKEKIKEFIEIATKDELLDFTAIHDIEAEYTESKKELKRKIKKYFKKCC